MFVTIKFILVDCDWAEWTTGTECTVSCGTGTRTKTRTKNVEEQHGGACTGADTEQEDCNTQECPSMQIFKSRFLFVAKQSKIKTKKHIEQMF